MSLKLVHPSQHEPMESDTAAETLVLSDEQVALVEEISEALNPDMPSAFGWPHAIRTLLDRFEKSGIDLTAASNEEEIVRVAAEALRNDFRRT